MEMIDPLNTVASVTSTAADRHGAGGGDASGSTPAAPTPVADPASPSPAASSVESLRLVVEPANGGTDFTYKLFDRTTGELVMELPSTLAAKMSESPDYSAGQVINAKA
jgi:hypothetical protein